MKDKLIVSGLSAGQVDAFFNTDENNPFEGKQPLKLFIIRSAAPLGGGPGGWDFIPAEMQQMLAKGEAAGDEFIASLQLGDITWA